MSHCPRCGRVRLARDWRQLCPDCHAEAKRRQLARIKAWQDERRELVRDYQRRYWKRLKTDPKRWAERREIQRMNYRLRAERNGRPIPPITESAYSNGSGASVPSGTVPAVLIAPLIREWLGEFGGRVLTNSDFGAPEGKGDIGAGRTELAALAGISERTVREILKGKRETVQFVTADRLCAALNVPLSSLHFES